MRNLFILIFVSLMVCSCAKKLSPDEQIASQLKQEITQDLTGNILPFWAKNAPDPAGGFYGTLNFDATPKPGAEKGGILNARLLWTFSSAYRVLGDDSYKVLADRAQRYFIDYFIDKEYGGSFYTLNADGTPLDMGKVTYQNAFAIYALSEHYRATNNKESLDAAIGIYNKFIEYVHDPVNGGFIETFTRDWQMVPSAFPKTMNNNLHVLEALTNLYRVWKDKGLKEILKEQIDVMSNKVLDQSTWHERLYLTMDWESRMKVDSYGHDIEFSWLLVEAAEVLKDKAILADTKRIAVQLAATQLEEGIDEKGAVINEKFDFSGSNFSFTPPPPPAPAPAPVGKKSETETAAPTPAPAFGGRVISYEWWPQAEAVVGFLNAWEISGDKKFLDAAVRSWEYIKAYFIDKEYGEWYRDVHPDGTAETRRGKADQWRCPYHNSRMGFEVISRFPY
jgi:mannobiose 2-epimerase